MSRFVPMRGHGLIVLAAVAVLAVSACGGSSATPVPSSTPTVTPVAATPTPAPTAANAGPGGAAAALANVNSYKFNMTLIGDFGSMVSSFGSASANGATIVGGTMTLKPDKSADFGGTGFRIVEVGGFDYMDLTGSGAYSQSTISTSLADAFSPSTIFSNSIVQSTTGDYTMVGSETKNGVQCDHYQAGPETTASYGSVLGITGATWKADVWISRDAGYLISVDVEAAAADGSLPYEMKIDITNVNNDANKVSAPTNVTGM